MLLLPGRHRAQVQPGISGIERPGCLLFLFTSCLKKVFVDRADRLNGDDAKVIRPERLLPGSHVGGMEEAVENLQVFNLNLSSFDVEGITEQIAIEVLAKLPEKLI